MLFTDTYPLNYTPFVPQILHSPDLTHAWAFAAFDETTDGDAIVAVRDDGKELTAAQVRKALEGLK